MITSFINKKALELRLHAQPRIDTEDDIYKYNSLDNDNIIHKQEITRIAPTRPT